MLHNCWALIHPPFKKSQMQYRISLDASQFSKRVRFLKFRPKQMLYIVIFDPLIFLFKLSPNSISQISPPHKQAQYQKYRTSNHNLLKKNLPSFNHKQIYIILIIPEQNSHHHSHKDRDIPGQNLQKGHAVLCGSYLARPRMSNNNIFIQESQKVQHKAC